MNHLEHLPPYELKFGPKEAMSTPRIWAVIDHFAGLGDNYLEVGSWCGATLRAAALGNQDTRCIGVDNFSFGAHKRTPEQHAKRTEWQREALERNVGELSNVAFIDGDYRTALLHLSLEGYSCDTYLFDGPHTPKDQYDGLEMALPMLTPDATIIVDDWNWKDVEVPTRMFCDVHGWEVVFEKKTLRNGSPDWWNGLAVLKRKK